MKIIKLIKIEEQPTNTNMNEESINEFVSNIRHAEKGLFTEDELHDSAYFNAAKGVRTLIKSLINLPDITTDNENEIDEKVFKEYVRHGEWLYSVAEIFDEYFNKEYDDYDDECDEECECGDNCDGCSCECHENAKIKEDIDEFIINDFGNLVGAIMNSEIIRDNNTNRLSIIFRDKEAKTVSEFISRCSIKE